MSGHESFEVVAIACSVGRALHRKQRPERAHSDDGAPEIHSHRLGIQLPEGRDLGQPLQNVDRAEIGGDERAITCGEEGADRACGETPLGRLDAAARLLKDSRESVQVAPVRVRDEIYVLRAAQVTPCIHRESADDHEAHFRGGQPVKQLT